LTASPAQTGRNRWLAALGYGLLAEVCTIVTIILITVTYRFVIARGLSDAVYEAFNQKTGGIVGVVGGTLFTYLFARMITRRVTANFVAHGLVVAVTAIVVSVGGSIAGHQGVPSAYILASILKIVAGWFAGFEGRKPAVT
jgi:hypothetical protein